MTLWFYWVSRLELVALILFAAIDGLGKLLHPKDNARYNERIPECLDYMGGDYQKHKEKLVTLRNSLVHNAINVESFFSHTEMSNDLHLKKVGTDDFIYVNTGIMYRDFIEAVKRFRSDIQNHPAMLKRAADRLEWTEVNPLEDLNIPAPSPPPPVQFIQAK